jgi:hypothetical protein
MNQNQTRPQAAQRKTLIARLDPARIFFTVSGLS